MPYHNAAGGRARLVATLLVFVCAATPLAAAPSAEEIRRILAERIDQRHQGVGIVAGVIDAEGSQIVAYGRRGSADNRPLDGQAIFELASVTKAFTGLLLMEMARRGEVALTDPVSKHLPPDVTMPKFGDREITLLDLATHTSGLPREPDNMPRRDPANPFADYTVTQLYRFLSNHKLTREPGTHFEYSNLGAGLLGHVLARRAGGDYETVVRRTITGPLGMNDTAATLSAIQQRRLVPGHDVEGKPVPNWDSPTLAGAGALRSNADDMLRFLAAATGLEASALAPAFETMATTRRRVVTPAPVEVGAGWGIMRNAGGEYLFVNGRSGGYRSWMGIDRTNRRGVILLTNADSLVEPDDIGRHLLNASFPLRTAFPIQRTEVALGSQAFDRYAGRYQFAPGVFLTVSRQGDRFLGQVTGQPAFQMYPESRESFFVKVVDVQIRFEETDGKVTGLVLRQGGRDQRASRVE
jgi:CubicO group peptidase (beta-lactamase class C family)